MIEEEILKDQFQDLVQQTIQGEEFKKKAKISCMIINPSKKKKNTQQRE